MEFAIFIANAINLSKPLIYMDESSFNTWSTKQQSWSGPRQRNEHVRPKNYYSVTVYAAIAGCLSQPVIMLGKSTNQKDYRQFLRLVKEKVKTSVTERPLLLFDGHPAHRTAKSMNLAN